MLHEPLGRRRLLKGLQLVPLALLLGSGRARAAVTAGAARQMIQEVGAQVLTILRDQGLDNQQKFDRLVALLDFDLVEVWDPLVDFFKLGWFVFESNPAARESFMADYLAGDPVPPMFDQRVRLASIVELVNHAASWRIQGQREIAEVALARLSALLEDGDV